MSDTLNINWYPGHMAKTKKEIIEDLKLIDVVIELIDARIPVSSRNPDIESIIKNKKRVIVLNKSDLSDEEKNNKWVAKFKAQGITAILTESNSGRGIQQVLKEVEKLMEQDLKQMAEKGRVGRKIRAIILGIPNVGKSSFINRVAKKSSAQVGNKPGVTIKKQWIRVNDKIELLDTPGVLWPKFQDEQVALNLAFTGTIKDEIIDKVEVSYYLIKYLLENYKTNLCERYKIKEEELQQVENEGIYEVMQLIGKKRGAIVSGAKVDDEKTARIILEDFRSGLLGKITLEMPM